MDCFARKFATVLLIVGITTTNIKLGYATIVVISRATNETVFSAEEVGVDAASAYNLKVGNKNTNCNCRCSCSCQKLNF